jgi:hypothetical protein
MASLAESWPRIAAHDPHALARAFSPAPPRPPWVYDLGICDRCAGLTERGHCPVCEPGPVVERRSRVKQRQELRRWREQIDPAGEQARLDGVKEWIAEKTRKRERVVDQVRLRPSWVYAEHVAEAQGWTDQDDEAVLPVPDGASQSAKHVAQAVARIASERLFFRDTLHFALARLALGRDSVQQFLEKDMGIKLDRKTVAAALAELVALGTLDRVGQLESWWDNEQGMTKKGAYVYALKVRCRKLGDRAIEAVRRLKRRSGPPHAAVRGTGLGYRLKGCLSAAIREAQVGQRNTIGHWLACRCTDAGLDEGETMKVMRIYGASVPESGTYSAREAEATVRSRYRRLATA